MISAENGTELILSEMEGYVETPQMINCGAILFCRGGAADIHINFNVWHFDEGKVMTLFPSDVLYIKDKSDDFRVEVLSYSPDILREASLHIEQSIYSAMREDRLVKRPGVAEKIVEGMFKILHYYFEEEGCKCLNEILTLQLKSFFLGFYDYVKREKPEIHIGEGSRRTNELFNKFMEILEHHYKDSHEVAYYADLLCITPKYLGMIVQYKTGHSTKTIITEYIILQLKLRLQTTRVTVKQLAAEYHFSDVSFFTRYFKTRTGMTPQGYRQARLKK